MKKLLFALGVCSLLVVSCGKTGTDDSKKEDDVVTISTELTGLDNLNAQITYTVGSKSETKTGSASNNYSATISSRPCDVKVSCKFSLKDGVSFPLTVKYGFVLSISAKGYMSSETNINSKSFDSKKEAEEFLANPLTYSAKLP